MTSCEQYWELISAGLDDALSQEEKHRLECHLNQCPECRAMWEQFRVVESDLAKLQAPKTDFTDRVIRNTGQIRQDIPFTNLSQDRRGGKAGRAQLNAWWKPIRTLGVLAACCVLILGIGRFVVGLNNGFSVNEETIERTEESAAYTEEKAVDRDTAESAADSAPASDNGNTSAVSGDTAAADDDVVSAKIAPTLTLEGIDYQWTGKIAGSTEGYLYGGTVTEAITDNTEFDGWEYYVSSEDADHCLLTDGQTIQIWQRSE